MPSQQHDDVIALLRSLAPSPDAEPATVEASRERLDANGDLFPVPDTVTVTPFEIGHIPCEHYEPSEDETGGTILYLHGGAYVAGSLRSHRPLCARIADAARTPLIAAAYRVAPEDPFPAGLADATNAYRCLLEAGLEADRIVIAGDSAGGGLTAATLLSLHAEGTALPAGAVLISAWLDLTLTGESITTVADDDPLLDADALARSAEAYAGDDLTNPLVSPVYASDEDLATLPPLLILAGTADILVDDSRRFAERAAAAGADIALDVEPGLIHVWPFLDGIPEAATAMDRIGRWVRNRLPKDL